MPENATTSNIDIVPDHVLTIVNRTVACGIDDPTTLSKNLFVDKNRTQIALPNILEEEICAMDVPHCDTPLTQHIYP